MKPRRLVLGALPFWGLALTLYILGRLVNLTAALSALASAQWDWAAAAIFMTLLAPVIVAVKLWFVLKIIDYPASVARCWSAVLAAVTLQAVLPGRGGDLVQQVERKGVDCVGNRSGRNRGRGSCRQRRG